MDDLLENLKNYLAAGDEQRTYVLNRGEVLFIVKEIEMLRSRELKILSFADIRDEVRKKDRERLERQERADRIVRSSDG
jgi:hypothetical protein